MRAPAAAVFLVALLGGFGCTSEPVPPEPIYTYTGADGRPSYTDDLGRIPAKYRSSAKAVDLSHVSLNHELAKELAEQAQLGALAGTDVCSDAASASSDGWLQYVRLRYRQHPAPMALAGLALLLVITAPLLFRLVGPRRWLRVLALVLPMITALAIFTYAARQLRASHQRELHTADACNHGEPERVPEDHREAVVRKLREAYLQSSRSASESLELDR